MQRNWNKPLHSKGIKGGVVGHSSNNKVGGGGAAGTQGLYLPRSSPPTVPSTAPALTLQAPPKLSKQQEGKNFPTSASQSSLALSLSSQPPPSNRLAARDLDHQMTRSVIGLHNSTAGDSGSYYNNSTGMGGGLRNWNGGMASATRNDDSAAGGGKENSSKRLSIGSLLLGSAGGGGGVNANLSTTPAFSRDQLKTTSPSTSQPIRRRPSHGPVQFPQATSGIQPQHLQPQQTTSKWASQSGSPSLASPYQQQKQSVPSQMRSSQAQLQQQPAAYETNQVVANSLRHRGKTLQAGGEGGYDHPNMMTTATSSSYLPQSGREGGPHAVKNNGSNVGRRPSHPAVLMRSQYHPPAMSNQTQLQQPQQVSPLPGRESTGGENQQPGNSSSSRRRHELSSHSFNYPPASMSVMKNRATRRHGGGIHQGVGEDPHQQLPITNAVSNRSLTALGVSGGCTGGSRSQLLANAAATPNSRGGGGANLFNAHFGGAIRRANPPAYGAAAVVATTAGGGGGGGKKSSATSQQGTSDTAAPAAAAVVTSTSPRRGVLAASLSFGNVVEPLNEKLATPAASGGGAGQGGGYNCGGGGAGSSQGSIASSTNYSATSMLLLNMHQPKQQEEVGEKEVMSMRNLASGGGNQTGRSESGNGGGGSRNNNPARIGKGRQHRQPHIPSPASKAGRTARGKEAAMVSRSLQSLPGGGRRPSSLLGSSILYRDGDASKPDLELDLPLPPNWEMEVTDDGYRYYVDHNNQRTHWIHPLASERLVAGWVKIFDPQHGVVYYNKSEDHSQFEHPGLAEPVAPALLQTGVGIDHPSEGGEANHGQQRQRLYDKGGGDKMKGRRRSTTIENLQIIKNEVVPEWIRLYSEASSESDHLLDWHLFPLEQLEQVDHMLMKLFKQDAIDTVIKYEKPRREISHELMSRQLQ